MATTQTQTQTQRTKKASAKATGVKRQTTTASKAAKKTYGFTAGVVVKITHQGLSRALDYHTRRAGTIIKTAEGYKLTDAGVKNFSARAAANPEAWPEIAAFVHGKGNTPRAWANQPTTEAGPGLKLPNMIHWGGMTTANMRLAFAALWAK